MIYAVLTQNFVVRIYALIPQIFLDWKAKSADIFTFWMYVLSTHLSTSGLGLFLHFLSRCSNFFLFLSFPSFQTLSASLVRMVLKVVIVALSCPHFHLCQFPPEALPAPPVHQDGVLQLPLYHQLDSPPPPPLLPRPHPRTLYTHPLLLKFSEQIYVDFKLIVTITLTVTITVTGIPLTFWILKVKSEINVCQTAHETSWIFNLFRFVFFCFFSMIYLFFSLQNSIKKTTNFCSSFYSKILLNNFQKLGFFQ